MKKICSIIMAMILCFSVFSCEQKTEETDNSIQLTIDNYSKYLNYSAGVGGDNYRSFNVTNSAAVNPLPERYWYDSGARTIYVEGIVEPISPHYIYNDITVKIKASFCFEYFKYPGYWVREKEIIYHNFYNPIECEVVIKLDINGNGVGHTYLDLKDYLIGVVDEPSEYLVDAPDSYYNIDFEVIEISGTLTPTF